MFGMSTYQPLSLFPRADTGGEGVIKHICIHDDGEEVKLALRLGLRLREVHQHGQRTARQKEPDVR